MKQDLCRNVPDFLAHTKRKLCRYEKKTARGPCKQISEGDFFVVSCMQSSLVPFNQEEKHGKHTNDSHQQTLRYLKCRCKTNLQPKNQTHLGKVICMCSSICSNCQHKLIYWVSRWHILVLLSGNMIESWRVSKAEKTSGITRKTLSKILWKLSKM